MNIVSHHFCITVSLCRASAVQSLKKYSQENILEVTYLYFNTVLQRIGEIFPHLLEFSFVQRKVEAGFTILNFSFSPVLPSSLTPIPQTFLLCGDFITPAAAAAQVLMEPAQLSGRGGKQASHLSNISHYSS